MELKLLTVQGLTGLPLIYLSLLVLMLQMFALETRMVLKLHCRVELGVNVVSHDEVGGWLVCDGGDEVRVFKYHFRFFVGYEL